MTASAEMPSGHHASRADWDRLEQPLLQIDPVLETFATAIGLDLARNERGTPNRAFRWDDSLSRLIQIYGSDSDDLLWNLWTCASQDRGAERFWKREILRSNEPISDLALGLENELWRAFELVSSWDESALEFATSLQ